MSLDTATTAATRNDWPAALSALLSCWASAPAVDLADLIDRIDGLVPKPPYAGSGKRLRVAVLDDSSNQVHRIASMLPQLQRDEAEIVLRRASQREPDPRWGTVMASWLRAPPFISGHALWKAVAVLIEHTADARLADIVQRPIREALPYELFGAMTGAWTRFGSVASTWPVGPTSGLDALAGLVESAEAAAEEQATLQSDLFERFARDEADEGLPVLADLLQQAGDPRGELIALQCLPNPGSAETRRIAQILRDYGSAFCGPLAPFVLKRGRRFEKGYLHTATVRFKKPSQIEALGGCALGGTIRDIDLNGTVSWADVRSPWELGLPFLTGLRRARGVERPQGLFALLLHGSGIERIDCIASEYLRMWELGNRYAPPEGKIGAIAWLSLPPEAMGCLNTALARGLTVGTLRWCVRPNSGFAESLKYGSARREGMTGHRAVQLVRQTPTQGIGRLEIAVGFDTRPERVLRAVVGPGGWVETMV